MKTYSFTEGEFPHAGTSIAQDGDSGNRRSFADGTADPTSRTAGPARGLETSRQAMGGPAPGLCALWSSASPTGRNDASADRHDLRTRAGDATTFSLSILWASVLSGPSLVRRTQGRHHQPPIARSGHAGRVLLALSTHGLRNEMRASERWMEKSHHSPF